MHCFFLFVDVHSKIVYPLRSFDKSKRFYNLYEFVFSINIFNKRMQS